MDNRGQVDTFILDFEKAFDTPPHELLKSKLFSYGIGGKTLKWIESFLCFRQQRVIVNGVKSDWAPVLSDVSQGTVLGPLLFSLYINHISSDIESEIRLLADDCVCYRELVGNPIGKKTLIFTFDGKIEYIILPMLILFLDMWQNTYGWMPSL